MVIWRRGRRSKACLPIHVLHLQGAALRFFSLLRMGDEQVAERVSGRWHPGLETTAPAARHGLGVVVGVPQRAHLPEVGEAGVAPLITPATRDLASLTCRRR